MTALSEEARLLKNAQFKKSGQTREQSPGVGHASTPVECLTSGTEMHVISHLSKREETGNSYLSA